jgi:DNA-binding Xre family transcriptional regulator
MPLSIREKITVMLTRRNMTLTQLANATGQSPQNMSNKMSRDNFSEKEIIEIAKALNCTFNANFRMNDTGEEV